MFNLQPRQTTIILQYPKKWTWGIDKAICLDLVEKSVYKHFPEDNPRLKFKG
jgi:hypothetical protein